MAKTNITIEIEKALHDRFKNTVFSCPEVTIGYYGDKRVDYVTMDYKDIIRCYEVKVTKSDFKSKNGHNFVGHYNYYVIPEELYENVRGLVGTNIGVMVYDGWSISVKKNPKKCELKTELNILKNSMIRSLNREVNKFYRCTDPEMVMKLERDLRNAKDKTMTYREAYQTISAKLEYPEHYLDKLELIRRLRREDIDNFENIVKIIKEEL